MPIPLKFKAAFDDSALMAGLRRIKTAFGKLAGGSGVGRRGTYFKKGGLGSVFGGAAAVGGARSVLQQGDALYNLSRKTGMATTSLAALAEMGKGANIEMEQLASSVVKMQAAFGSDKGKDAIESLGLSVERLKEMKPEVAFATIGDAIGKLADQNKKVAAAMGVFGKSGADMFELFDDSGKMDMSKVSKNAKLRGDSAKDLADASDTLETGAQTAGAAGSYIFNQTVKGFKQFLKDAKSFGTGFMQDRQNFLNGGNPPPPSPFRKDSYVQRPAMKHGSPFENFLTANKGGTALGSGGGLGSVGGLSGGAYRYTKRGDAAIAKEGPVRMAQLKAAEEARDHLKELKETIESWDQ